MSLDKIEIILNEVDKKKVDLSDMSPKALDSFLTVTNSFRNIVLSITENVSFSITKGSVNTSVHGTSTEILNIYKHIDNVIEGNSNDDNLIKEVRTMQTVLKNECFSYMMRYQGVDFGEKLKHSRKVSKKRVRKQFEYQLALFSGYLYDLGGVSVINFHLNLEDNKIGKIKCTEKQAKEELRPVLFSEILCIVANKVGTKTKECIESSYITLLNVDEFSKMSRFTSKYNSTSDLLDKLDLIYDFIDSSITKEKDVLLLLKIFRNDKLDINEINTVLIVSKGFTNINSEILSQYNLLENMFNKILAKK